MLFKVPNTALSALLIVKIGLYLISYNTVHQKYKYVQIKIILNIKHLRHSVQEKSTNPIQRVLRIY